MSLLTILLCSDKFCRCKGSKNYHDEVIHKDREFPGSLLVDKESSKWSTLTESSPGSSVIWTGNWQRRWTYPSCQNVPQWYRRVHPIPPLSFHFCSLAFYLLVFAYVSCIIQRRREMMVIEGEHMSMIHFSTGAKVPSISCFLWSTFVQWQGFLLLLL